MTFFDETEIRKYANEADLLLRGAIDGARKRNSVTRGDLDLLKSKHREMLVYPNRHSRIHWGEAVCEQLALFFGPGDGDEERFSEMAFLTIADISCAISPTIREIDIDRFKRTLRWGLRGYSYLGVIEPAYYVNLQAGVRFNGKRCVFWHLHAIIWNERFRDVEQHARYLNRSGRYRSIADGLKAVKAKRVKDGGLPGLVGYMMKPPTLGYRVSRHDVLSNGEAVVNEDGEIKAKFKQRKAYLRKGERLSLFHATKHLYLDKLTIAGGEGVKLLAEAKRKALRPPVTSDVKAPDNRPWRRKPRHLNGSCVWRRQSQRALNF